MRRTTVLLAAAMLVVAGVPGASALVQQGGDGQPGATFAGVVGVQGAEVEGEVAGRALDRRLAAAESNGSRAAVVAGEAASVRDQLRDLRDRRETLRERRKAGEISHATYRAKLARIAAQTRSLERRLNATVEVARALPEQALREHGVNVSALAELRRNAAALNDGEAAEAARQIAGKGVGNGLAGTPGPPEDRGNGDGPPDGVPGDGAGPPDDAGNAGDTGDGAVGAGDAGNSNAGGSGNSAGGDNGNVGGAAGADRGNANATGSGSSNASTGGGSSNASGGAGADGSAGGSAGSDPAAGDPADGTEGTLQGRIGALRELIA